MTPSGSGKRRKIKVALAARDGAFCRWCLRPLDAATATIEHVIPLSRGGTWAKRNLALACAPCNHSRGAPDWPVYSAAEAGVFTPPEAPAGAEGDRKERAVQTTRSAET